MGEFSASWLALREPADVRARASALTDETVRRVASASKMFAAVDLGTGTGSNVRYIVPRVPGPQEWLVIDEDAGLLAAMPAGMRAWAADRGLRITARDDGLTLTGDGLVCGVTTRRADLATLFDAQGPDALFPRRSLVSASALLDLVSPAWIDQLADACRAVDAVALFALNYDGRLSCTPELPDDALVRDLVNAHQRTDKGFGPALGPLAAAHAEAALGQRGYRTRCAPSDWVIGPDEALLQRGLIDGWADAAVSMASAESERVARWRHARAGFVEAGRSRLVVGHLDIAGWLD